MRTVAAVAALWSMMAAPLAAAVSIQPRPGQRWAVIIGRDEDDGGRTAGELARLAKMLRVDFGYTESHMVERYDKDTRAEQVRETLRSVLGRIEPPDSLFLFLALPMNGSGEDASFLTHEGSREQPWTLLPAFELEKMLYDLPARASLIVLPGCPSPAQQQPSLFQHLAYSRGGDRALSLLRFCAEARDAANDRAAFVRALRSVVETTPAKGAPLNGEDLFQQLQAREGPFRLERSHFPPNARPQFAFTRQGGRLDPLLESLAAAATDPLKESAIAALVRAVLEEPDPTRAGAVVIAGASLLSLATSTSAGESVSVRAIVALGEIGYDPAVDPLAELLSPSRSPSVRKAALDALARIRDDRALPVLKQALKDPDPALRSTAVRALGARKQEDAFPELLRLTRDGSDIVKVAALQAVAGFPGHKAEIRQVAERMLADQRPTVRREAASVLGGLGPSSVSPAMLTLLQADPDPTVRQAVAYSIGRSFIERDRAAVEKALVEAARAADPQVREAALWALGTVGGLPAERALRNALRAPEPSVRRMAVEKLGEADSTASVPDLIRMLGDQREPGDVRQAAARALGQIGDPRALEPLLRALKDDNAYVRGAAEASLQLLKGPPAARFVERLRDPAPRVRAEAAERLGESGTVAYVPRLVALLADDDETVRQSAVRALVRFKDPAAERQLILALADKDFRIRQGAVAALGSAGRAASVTRLLPLLKDPVGSVRAEAVRSVGLLGSPEHPDVLNAMHDEDAAVRLALAETLAPLSSPAARQALLRLARDPAVQVRQVAVSALGVRSK